MDPALATTKLYIPPPRPDLVPRPHLIRRLDQSLRPGHQLTLISAPAGFGKTTLVNVVIGRSVGDVGNACTWPAWRSQPVLPAPGAGTGGRRARGRAGGGRRWRPAAVVPGGHAEWLTLGTAAWTSELCRGSDAPAGRL